MACSLPSASRICAARPAGALAAVLVCLLFTAQWQRLYAQQERNPDAPTPRQIAPAMSWVYADWLTRPERQREEQPDRLVNSLDIQPGATVVDLGAGVGYFTWRLASKVGPAGKVIAVEIQQEMLDMLAVNLRERGIENVEPVLATPQNPRLPPAAVDLVLLVDVYHELAHPALTLAHIRRSLKPAGRLVIVEYRKSQPELPIHPLHKMSVAEVRSEVEPAGFDLEEVLEFLPSQHVIIFTPASG
ncbi:MAG: class I SAM-dependent methyltransferase [Acidobacteriia bacterium]|nr:class I SAM-dependent methyltransferase [Terriglobia bacterium]